MPYKEAYDEYDLNETEDGVQGQRVFVQDPAGTVTNLPIVGQSLMVDHDDVSISACLCRQRRTRIQQGGIPHIICSYSTKESSIEYSGSAISRDTGTRTYEGHAEQVPLAEPFAAGFQWDSGNGVEQAFAKQVPVTTFTRPIHGLTELEAEALNGTLEGYLGTINSAEFEGHRIGSVYFGTYYGGSYRDEDGDLRFAFNLQFTKRLINDELGTVTQDDWLYEINQATGEWEKVKNVAGTPKYRYKKADFAAIFTA